MEQNELIQKFNPANALNLTDEDRSYMRTLTDDQIKILAKAYPDDPNKKAYLVLFDTRLADNKQLYNMSTWEKLNTLRTMNNLKNFKAYDFLKNWERTRVQKPGQRTRIVPQSQKVVVDMSAKEATRELNDALKQRYGGTGIPAAGNGTVETATSKKTGSEKPARKTDAARKSTKKTTDAGKETVPATAANTATGKVDGSMDFSGNE